MSTDKKPTYEQCYICGHVDHWVPDCPKKEDNFTSQQTYQHLQRSNRLSLHYIQKKPSRKREGPESEEQFSTVEESIPLPGQEIK